MAIIKLTGIGVDEGTTLFVNTNQIVYFLEGTGYIKFPNGDVFWTKETPEEILALINGEVSLDNNPCKYFMGFSKEYIAKEAKEKGLTFKECMLFIYFYLNLAKRMGTTTQMIKEIETCKAFSKAAVKAYSLIKEAEKL